MSYALCTVQQIKDVSGITASTWDTRLQMLAERVGREVSNYCDRILIAASALTEYHSFNVASPYLYVRCPPITSVTYVYEDVSHDYDASSLLTVDDDYRVSTDEDGLILREGGSWAMGDRSVKVVYVGGYASQAVVPSDLQGIAAEIAFFYWQMTYTGDKRIGIASKSMADGSVSGYLQSVPPYLRSALDPYRRKTA